METKPEEYLEKTYTGKFYLVINGVDNFKNGVQTQIALSKLLLPKISNPTMYELIPEIVKFQGLFKNMISEIENSSLPNDFYETELRGLESNLSLGLSNLNDPWNLKLGALTNKVYRDKIKHWAWHISEHESPIFAKKSELIELSNDLHKLINEIHQKEINSTIKELIIRNLEESIKALNDYLVYGEDKFEVIYSKMLGDAFIHASCSTKEEKDIFQFSFNTLTKINTVIQSVKNSTFTIPEIAIALGLTASS